MVSRRKWLCPSPRVMEATDVPVPPPPSRRFSGSGAGPGSQAMVSDVLGAVSSGILMAGTSPEEREEEEELPQRPRAPPKLGKISFNIQGAKEAMQAAKAQKEVEQKVAAVRERKMNTKDATTQTEKNPEAGGIVCIYRYRPRGMESFPHFPRRVKKKARPPPVITLDVDDVGSPASDGQGPAKKAKMAVAAAPESPEDDDDGEIEDDAIAAALAAMAQGGTEDGRPIPTVDVAGPE